jgi:S-(hydroxymethyl)mycothiol dehydrogenase
VTTTGHGVVVRERGGAARIEELSFDEPGPGEVLVRLGASGVCHTDLNIKRNGSDAQFPCLLGHEGAGVVEAVGPGVTDPTVGDAVVLAWRAPCGDCRFCRRGQPHWCAATLRAAPRITGHDGASLRQALGLGTYATHTVVHARQAIRVPPELPPEQMCLIGCGVMTGVGAVLHTAGVPAGAAVAVFGCGGVGTSVIQGARLAGATTVIGVDVDPRKLRWAEELGATHVVDATAADPVASVKELTGGFGVPFAFDAAGLAVTFRQTLDCLDQRGTAVLVGSPPAEAVLELGMRAFHNSYVTVKACLYGDCLPSRDFPVLAEWYRAGRLKLDHPVVTRTIALDDVEEAFEAMERGETLRSVIRMTG